ncbi:hypothetical protein [Flocculibacter collagenilyticus]|uniref:hypothetical protein n=1 Tax=Flocculibacter collagenilyticus TaxID=2744479 RepID=UPI0018F64212|nr:hypothetical protein [Flocculibacter collagenilyticus]
MMNEVTLDLVKLSLNMQTIKQSVAAKNIANIDSNSRITVNFEDLITQLESMSESQKSQYVKVLNENTENLNKYIQTDNTELTSIESEHADSTKAMLEYQAMIEALNRKISMKALVMGGSK